MYHISHLPLLYPMPYINKTQPTKKSPKVYLQEAGLNEEKLADAHKLLALYSQATGAPCVLWNKIFGFGSYRYLDSTGHEHTYLATGFAISSSGFTLYNILGWEAYAKDLARLGTHKLSGKSCLAIKHLRNIDPDILAKIVKKSFADMQKKYPVVL